MQRYFGRVVRALIVSLFGFGGGVGLMVFIVTLVLKGDQHAFEYGLKAGIFCGMVFSVLLVGVLLPLDLTAHLFLAKGRYREIWELEQTRETVFEGSLKDTIATCRRALLAVPYVKAVFEDVEKLVVMASVGPSWRSGGEEVEVKISPIGEDKWQLRCISRSSSQPVLFDYGKNFDNVEAWLREMTSVAKNTEKAA
jgi:hypothetical protein